MKSLCRAIVVVCGVVYSTAAAAYAQQSSATPRQACPGVEIVHAPSSVPDAPDYSFRLSIVDCRIQEPQLRAATAVTLGAAGAQRGVDVRVGAEVSTGVITIRLQGIEGSGRFRASLEALKARLNLQRR